jgi:hypothetical protein
MPAVSKAFFIAGALCALVGMIWGTVMGASGDHSLSPAHAHLNLLGFVTLSIMGGFYALKGEGGRLAWVNLALSAGGAVVMAPMLAYLLGNVAERGPVVGPLMMIPEGMCIAGLLVFIVAIWRSRPRAAGAPPLQQAA